MIEENSPLFELDKENVLRIVKMLSKKDSRTIVPAFSMTSIFMKSPGEIEAVMDELVQEGKLTKKRFMGQSGYGTK